MKYLTVLSIAGAILLFAAAAFGQSATIQPNPMYVYQAHALDPIIGQITVGAFANGHTLQDIDLTSLHVNDTIVPLASAIVDNSGSPELHIDLYIKGFIEGYGILWDSNDLPFIVSGLFTDSEPFSAGGIATIIGRLSGDANNDNAVDIADATFIVSYIFANGAVPRPLEAADANCDGSINIADVSYLINYVFGNGLKPCVKK